MNDKQVQLIIERLKERIQKANELFLTNIGENIKKLKKLKPSDAQKLIQILKYGGNYEEMIKKIAKYTQMNVEDVDKIFSAFAKKDMEFNKQFYDYRNIPFEEYSKNMPLQRQTEAIANMVKNEIYNFSRTNVLGYTIKDNEGNEIFKGLRETYNDLLDTAFLNVGQGKETFDQAMRSVLKSIGESGLKTLDYESGRSIRLDSAITMHLRSRLTELHNENQKLIGEQYDADGVEISVHLNSAPDHEEAQGHQFYIEDYEKLQSEGVAKDVNGKEIDLHRELKDGDSADTFRPIGEYNCYHYEFRIVVGVNTPEYNEKQLQEIIDTNNKGFEYEGKHYTNYQGEQLQRKLETAIREQKDIQILGRASNDKTMIDDADKKIKILTNKYNDLSKASGLKAKKDRLSVSGYRSSIRQGNSQPKGQLDLNYNVLDNKEMSFDEWKDHFKQKYGNIRIDDSVQNIDDKLINRNLEQFDYLSKKYNVSKYHEVNLEASQMTKPYIGWTRKDGQVVRFGQKYFVEKDKLIDIEKYCQEVKWHNKINEKDYDIYTITHEYGHVIEDTYMQEYIKKKTIIPSRKEIDSMIRDDIMSNVVKNTGLTRTEIKNKYFSRYANSQRNFEWFAEGFANIELGEPNPFSEELEKWIKEKL